MFPHLQHIPNRLQVDPVLRNLRLRVASLAPHSLESLQPLGQCHALAANSDVVVDPNDAVPRSWDNGNVLLALMQVRALQGRVSQVRASQVRVLQVRASQVRASKVRALQVRASQVRASKVRALQVRASQVRASKVRVTQVRALQVRVTQVRASQRIRVNRSYH
jgi:hypothetical protein